ncbi:MAG TPA: TetR family transcriptional regulator [Vicinamibacteria bacterium]|nr:TetR family transcriptional regulator [Vicinamibacteria bacterium]
MTIPATRRPRRRARPFARAVPPGSTSLMRRKQEVVRVALAGAAEGLFVSRGFEQTTVEQIARAAGVSRRTFFRYFESKEDVLAVHAERFGERLYSALSTRPPDEPPLLAIRNALVPALQAGVEDADVLRCTIRLLRETNSLRRVVLARRNRLEERVAALMTRRLGAETADSGPMLLAFLTRALLDTAFNAWYDHETDDIAGLVDGLIHRLRGFVKPTRRSEAQLD